MAGWKQLKQQGELEDFNAVVRMVEEEVDEEEEIAMSEEEQRQRIDALIQSGDASEVVAIAKDLSDLVWEYAMGVVLRSGDLRCAWESIVAAESIRRRLCWQRVALEVAAAALKVDETGSVADRALAEEALQLLEERRCYAVALELRLEFAGADAEAAALRLRAEVAARREGEPTDASDAPSSASLFEQALRRIHEATVLAESWGVEPQGCKRWNRLIRLLAKQRNMPSVFAVLDAMDTLAVEKDQETYEFVARSAVATVKLSAMVDSFETMPPPHFPEIVFLGRSNVGKSSLVNSLLHRKALAPVAAMPGHTTRFHFYDVNEKNALFPRVTLVDVPGLGVAVTDAAQLTHWKATLLRYLRERGPMLRGVFHLVSAEALTKHRCLTDIDMEIADVVAGTSAQYTLVLTKVDNLQNKKGTWANIVLNDWMNDQGLDYYAVPSSIKSRIGRDLLWKRLWSCVDPENTRWRGVDLVSVKCGLDELVASSDAAAIEQRAGELDGDAWEYAVRCLLQLGELDAAWRVVLAAAVAPDDASEVASHLGSVVERAILAVGEAALALDERMRPADKRLGEEALARLRKAGAFGAAAELQLELVLAEVGEASASQGDRTLDGALSSMEDLVAQAVDGGARPWGVERWNRLLELITTRCGMASLGVVLDAMATLQIKESTETHELVAKAAATSLRLTATAQQLPELQDALPPLPTALFVGGSGVQALGEQEAGASFAPLVDSLLSVPYAIALGKQAAGRSNAWANPVAPDVSLMQVNADSKTSGLVPPVAIVDVPVTPKPTVAPGYLEAREAWEAQDGMRCREVCEFLRQPRSTPLSIFHVVDARELVEEARALVPANEQFKMKQLAVGDEGFEEVRLPPNDLAVQKAALESGATHYTLVVADASELGSEPRRRKDKVKLNRAHPKVILKREDVLGASLQRSAEAQAGETQVSVIFTEQNRGRGRTALWRRLWQSAGGATSS